MTRANIGNSESTAELAELVKKSLMLELFQAGVTQAEIGRKLKVQKATVNAFLKGIKKQD